MQILTASEDELLEILNNMINDDIDSIFERNFEEEEIVASIKERAVNIFSEEGLGYEKYSEGISEYDMTYKGFSQDFKMLISWYLKERKENIYSKVAERKRVAYKVLEDKCGENLEKSNREPKETDSY